MKHKKKNLLPFSAVGFYFSWPELIMLRSEEPRLEIWIRLLRLLHSRRRRRRSARSWRCSSVSSDSSKSSSSFSLLESLSDAGVVDGARISTSSTCNFSRVAVHGSLQALSAIPCRIPSFSTKWLLSWAPASQLMCNSPRFG